MAGMKKVYFVRHGESQWNVEDKICGVTDSPLTEKGHQQAVDTGKTILRLGIEADIILHPPLLRAQDTTRPISAIKGITMEVEERSIEHQI